MPSKRRKAREIALKALYQQDLVGHAADQAVAQILSEEILHPAFLTFFREALHTNPVEADDNTAIGEALAQAFEGLLALPRPSSETIHDIMLALAPLFPDISKNQLFDMGHRIHGKIDGIRTVEEFAGQLVSLTTLHQKDIDTLLETFADNWSLPRMASLDRCILRVATCEMLFFPEIPISVTINEAIEMAKKYSTERSCEFVNGILDKIQRERKPEKLEKSEKLVQEPSLAPEQEPVAQPSSPAEDILAPEKLES